MPFYYYDRMKVKSSKDDSPRYRRTLKSSSRSVAASRPCATCSPRVRADASYSLRHLEMTRVEPSFSTLTGL